MMNTSKIGRVDDEKYIYLTTIGRNTGRSHTVELWFAMTGGKIYLSHEGAYQRAQRLYLRILNANQINSGVTMDVLTIVLIAIGLAMDAFAVSIAKGIIIEHRRRESAMLLASFFGGFQMLMPMIGYFAGLSLREAIMGIDHWIAFGLLTIIGLKMIYDSLRNEDGAKEESLKLHSLLTLSVATSIDALMVGLSFAFLQAAILVPVLAIGFMTFLLSITGFFFGCGLGRIFGNKVKIAGGLMLIAIGIRILLEHLA